MPIGVFFYAVNRRIIIRTSNGIREPNIETAVKSNMAITIMSFVKNASDKTIRPFKTYITPISLVYYSF